MRLDEINNAWPDEITIGFDGGDLPAIESDLGAFTGGDVQISSDTLLMLASNERAHIDRVSGIGRTGFHRLAHLTSRSTKPCATLPTGTAIEPAMQRSPAQPNADAWMAAAAWSRSASGMTIR